MIAIIIIQAAQKSDPLQPVSLTPSCSIDELVNLDSPPNPNIGSPEVYKTKQQQLRALKAFLEKEI
jgi:hypothetical protein